MTTIIKNGTSVSADLSCKADLRIDAEEISPDWAAAGTEVLLHACLDVAEVVG